MARAGGLSWGNRERGEAGRALKAQGKVVWPSGHVRRIEGARFLRPLCSSAQRLHHNPPAPSALRLGSQLSKGSFSPPLSLSSSAVSVPGPVFLRLSLCVCLSITALFCLISLPICIAILFPSMSPLLLCLDAASLSFSVPLCLALIPSPVSACAHLHPYVSLVHVSPLSPSLSLSSSCFRLQFPSLVHGYSCLHLCTYISRLLLCIRLCLLSSSTPLPQALSLPRSRHHPLSWAAFVVRRDGTSLGAGPRGWIGITRLSGRIELTSHERSQARLPSLLLGRRWGSQGKGSGPSGLARCVETKSLVRIEAGWGL